MWARPAGSRRARDRASTTRLEATNRPMKLVTRPSTEIRNAAKPRTGMPAAVKASMVPSSMPATSSQGTT